MANPLRSSASPNRAGDSPSLSVASNLLHGPRAPFSRASSFSGACRPRRQRADRQSAGKRFRSYLACLQKGFEVDNTIACFRCGNTLHWRIGNYPVLSTEPFTNEDGQRQVASLVGLHRHASPPQRLDDEARRIMPRLVRRTRPRASRSPLSRAAPRVPTRAPRPARAPRAAALLYIETSQERGKPKRGCEPFRAPYVCRM